MNPNPLPPPVEHQFKPGQSGNPNGAPPGRRLATLLKKILDGEIEIDDLETGLKRKVTKAEVVALSLFKQAVKGNVKAIKEVFDQVDGKLPQPLIGDGGMPLFPPTIIMTPYTEEVKKRVEGEKPSSEQPPA